MIRHRYLPFLLVTGILMIASAFLLLRLTPPPRNFARLQQMPAGPMPLNLRAATATERRAAIAAIQAQLDAFRKNDYQKAAQYQSAELRKKMLSLNAFRDMITKGYPQFANYRKVVYGPVQADEKAQNVVVPLMLTGRDSITVRALYIMVLENKTYRIAGVEGGRRSRRDAPRGPRPNATPATPSLSV